MDKELKQALEKEELRNEMADIKKNIRNLSTTLDANSIISHKNEIKVHDDANDFLSMAASKYTRFSKSTVKEPHKELIQDLPDNFSDKSMVENYKMLRALDKKNRKMSSQINNEDLLKEGKLKIEIKLEQIKKQEQRKKIVQ